jgi:ribosomal protein S12 methylthiotransferase accessory factor
VDKNPPLSLHPRFTHLVREGDEGVLVGEDDFVPLRDAVVLDVVRLVNGRRSAVDIARALGEFHREEIVHFALLLLEDGGVVVPARRPSEFLETPATDRSPELASTLKDAWDSRLEPEGTTATTVQSRSGPVEVILTEDYLDPAVERFLEGRGHDGARVLLTRIGASTVWVGPFVTPRARPCFECLRARLRLNRPARTLLYPVVVADRHRRVQALERRIPPRAFEIVGDMLLQVGGLRENVLREVPVDGSQARDHIVVALPQCPWCGNPGLTTPGAEITLVSRRKAECSGGGFRTVPPEETLHRVKTMVSPITGVARSVRAIRVDGLDSVHVYSANHAHHHGTASFTDLREEGRDHSGGKGWTDLDARVSAICESLERVSSVHRGSEPCRIARMSELGSTAVAPGDLMNFSADQLARRKSWNEQHGGGFQWISEPYADQAIEWSPVRSMTTDEIRWVPSAFIYYGQAGEGARFCDGDSNGLASGNCLEEAVLQGLLELVERDAVALWWYNRVSRPKVSLPISQDSWISETEAHYRNLGRSLWALDVTTDVGIPVMVGVSARDGGDVIFGFGAHPDARVALRRALTEVNQMLTSASLEPREREARLKRDYPAALEWWEGHTLDTDPYLKPASRLPSKVLGDRAGSASEDLLDDVLDCVSRVASVGCDVLVHDLTRPDVSFPVVKVAAPGLRHFWRRLGPGRLYDVPIRLGWIPQPRSEVEMNPVSMFV